jgi:hypothetical protein
MPKGHTGVKRRRDTNQLEPQIGPALTVPTAPAAAPCATRGRDHYRALT